MAADKRDKDGRPVTDYFIRLIGVGPPADLLLSALSSDPEAFFEGPIRTFDVAIRTPPAQLRSNFLR